MKLREQRWVDALAGLVARPQIVAERLDDVVGGDADMRGALLLHLLDGAQHADHGAERPLLVLSAALVPIKMTEQLVGAVNQVNDHDARVF